MRLAVDTGGTFTDLVLEDDDGTFSLYKAPTRPADPVQGVLDVVAVAAEARGQAVAALLGAADTLIHGTTHPINAVLTGRTARTALLVTAGHPDVLVFREGGRTEPFNHTRPYPAPYVPRRLTFEVQERIASDGRVVTALDEAACRALLDRLAARDDVEAVAVCLLWSMVEPAHEVRVGELIEERLPGIPYTLSHRLNPLIREYRRASSTAIDASLKPLMTHYLGSLEERVTAAGFGGRVLIVTSAGGVLDAARVRDEPIHALGSGPAMAPVAGRWFAERDTGARTVIVADTGGTSFDVSLVRGGHIPHTRETWLGPRWLGHITGFPSVDVKSIGAGGGSIARVDEGGLLHVGPESAGADPGPVCYGRGGTAVTVTDACLTLGILSPGTFLGGRMGLDEDAARAAVEAQLARPLGVDVDEAAEAVLRLATEHMVGAIEQITLDQGIDCSGATIVGGGGAFGLNAVAIARRLGVARVVLPPVAAALSAAGGLLSDLTTTASATFATSTERWDFSGTAATVARLREGAEAFVAAHRAGAVASQIALSVDARYPHQVWELEVPGVELPEDGDGVARLAGAFHRLHREVFAIADPESPVEVVAWRVSARVRLRDVERWAAPASAGGGGARSVYLPGRGRIDAPVLTAADVAARGAVAGPALVELPNTTVLLDERSRATLSEQGSLVIDPGGAEETR